MTDAFTTHDTIAAISTPLGEGAIGIVRLSGKSAVDIAGSIFRSPSSAGLAASGSHAVNYGYIFDPATGDKVDEVLVTVMLAPRSYTREDVVEINCHGGLLPQRLVLGLAIKQGARLASPGEFTLRAFLNGRIDLTQAEAVADVIKAKTDKAERIAAEQLSGRLKDRIAEISEIAANVLSHIEAHIDFPEEDIEPGTEDEIMSSLLRLSSGIEALIGTYEEGRFMREGLRTAIVGRPNVGKSSLLNALLNTDRAIVTEMPGTTRDVIEEFLNIEGLPVRVMDTAGIRAAHDMAEEAGVKRSLMAMENADLVIVVLDGSSPLKDEDMEVLDRIRDKNAIIAVNKCDLPGNMELGPPPAPVMKISAKTGEGLGGLKAGIVRACVKGSQGDESVIVTNSRHMVALETALTGVKAAHSAMTAGEPLEISALELRGALNALGELTGEVTTDDILRRIFDSFCIGK